MCTIQQQISSQSSQAIPFQVGGTLGQVPSVWTSVSLSKWVLKDKFLRIPYWLPTAFKIKANLGLQGPSWPNLPFMPLQLDKAT